MDKKGKRKLVHAMTIRIALPALLTILLLTAAGTLTGTGSKAKKS